MNNKNIKVSVRLDIVNKATDSQKSLLGTGWKNVEITIDELIEHIKQGLPYTHQFTDGQRTLETFIRTDPLIADVNNEMTIEQALANSLVKDYSTFIHTTASHTPERHRFRIIFALDPTTFSADAYETMYEMLPSQRQVTSIIEVVRYLTVLGG